MVIRQFLKKGGLCKVIKQLKARCFKGVSQYVGRSWLA
jgi:hypothetical protein